jgi:hypothetical protein
MKTLRALAGAVLFLFLGGCATGNSALVRQFVGKNITVSIAPDVPLPETMVFDLPSVESGQDNPFNKLVEDLARQKLVSSFQDILKSASKPLGNKITASLRDKLKAENIFKAVTQEGGQAQLKLSVTRYGARAPQGLSSIKPLLAVSAELAVPHLGTIWKDTESVDEAVQDLKALDLKELALNPRAFSDPFGAAVDLITRRLVKKLAQQQ